MTGTLPRSNFPAFKDFGALIIHRVYHEQDELNWDNLEPNL